MKLQQNKTLKEFDKLNGQIEELYYEIAARQELSESAYAILQAILVLGDGCTQTEIYRYSELNKQTVNSSVRRLKEDGLIALQAGSGRELKIFLTEAGERLVIEKILPIEQAESAVFDEMTQEEQAEIIRLTNKYLTAFRQKVEEIMKERQMQNI